MSEIGIKARILLMTLVPAGLLAVTLGGWFAWQQSNQLERQLLERGLMTVEYLQRPSTVALIHQQPEELSTLLNNALNHSDVRAVSLLSPDQQLLTHAGPRMIPGARTLATDGLGAGTGLQVQASGASSRFTLPLLATAELIAQFPDALLETDQLLGWLEVELSHSSTQIRRYQGLLSASALIIIGLLITGGVVSTMGRRITDPVGQINDTIDRISEGQLDVRLGATGSRELDDLANGINTMARTLQSAQGELQQNIDQATEDLRQTLETIEIQNIELDMARKTAQEASRIKSEFLANMSHELRTPLNGILGFSNLLQRTELSPRQQEYLDTIGKSADNLLAIINEILDFSKIEAGKLILDNLPFNLRDLIQDTLTMLAPAAHIKGLELVNIIYRDTPLGLSGDPLRLKQILANLISNAIKFTHQGSVCVRTMLEQEDETHALLRISVTDTGVGLTSAEQKSLFQAFSQADNTLTRQSGGTGLGLVIAKRLVEQMHGEIGLHSKPGEGSEFWLTLRLNKSSQAADDLPNTPLAGLSAALIEPQLLSRQALLHGLEDLGLSVRLYDSPQVLEQQLQSGAEPPALVLLSSQQPNCGPGEPLNLAREWAKQYDSKYILLTETSEHLPELDQLVGSQCQVLSKPVCQRKLFRAALLLLRPQPQNDPAVKQPRQESLLKVLCVDDNPANLRLVETFLSEMGARVVTASSGEEALSITGEQRIDLIFMDVQMPGMDGRQTTAELRLREEIAGCDAVPIVALTAHALAEKRRQLLKCGMNDYLSKPISPEQLRYCVHRWTGIILDPLPEAPARDDEPQPEASTLDEALPVLDNAEGLRLAAGKLDLAEDMLHMLIGSLADERRRIEQALQQEQPDALLEHVHRLHGATRYCGVPQLRNCCQAAENRLKQGQNCRAEIHQLLQAIERLQACQADLEQR